MPEFRQNRATKNWVIVATERAKRPHDFLVKEESKQLPEFDPSCPFCPGNEHMTPPPILTLEKDGKWNIRVIPNKYPALVPNVDLKKGDEISIFQKDHGLWISLCHN